MLSFPVKFDRHHRPAPYLLSPYTLTLLHSETSLFSYSYLLPKFSPFVFNHLRTQVGRGRAFRRRAPPPPLAHSPVATVPLTPLESALTKVRQLTPLESALTEKGGGGYHLWLTGTPEKHRSGWPAIDKPRFLS